MLIYWLMMLVPIVFLIMQNGKEVNWFPWVVIAILFTLFIGLRHEVGGDWDSYLRNYNIYVSHAKFDNGKIEWGYYLLNRISGMFDGGIYLVNIMGAMIFMFGAIKFCQQQPSPLFSFFILVPFVIFVVVMGYSRQGIALGILLWAIAKNIKGDRLFGIIAVIMLATLFHTSAIIFLPLFLLVRNDPGSVIFKILAVSLIAPAMLLFANIELYIGDRWELYVEKEMESSGAVVRVGMNSVAAIILLLMRRRFKKLWPQEFPLMFYASVVSLICMVLVFYASTAIDRVVFYLIFIQSMVFGRIFLFYENSFIRTSVLLLIVIYYFLVWFVWSNFAVHAEKFIPYKNYLFN